MVFLCDPGIFAVRNNCVSSAVIPSAPLRACPERSEGTGLSLFFGEGSYAAERWVVTDPSLRPDGKEVGTAFRMTTTHLSCHPFDFAPHMPEPVFWRRIFRCRTLGSNRSFTSFRRRDVGIPFKMTRKGVIPSLSLRACPERSEGTGLSLFFGEGSNAAERWVVTDPLRLRSGQASLHSDEKMSEFRSG